MEPRSRGCQAIRAHLFTCCLRESLFFFWGGGGGRWGVVRILSELCHLVYCLEDQDKKSVAHGDQYVMILGRPDYSTIKKAAQQRWIKQLVCETSWPVWEP